MSLFIHPLLYASSETHLHSISILLSPQLFIVKIIFKQGKLHQPKKAVLAMPWNNKEHTITRMYKQNEI